MNQDYANEYFIIQTIVLFVVFLTLLTITWLIGMFNKKNWIII